jgi:hypothetical protein
LVELTANEHDYVFDFRAHFCHSEPLTETQAMSDSPSYPRMIMVIRHGEKPGASDDDKGGGPQVRHQKLLFGDTQ